VSVSLRNDRQSLAGGNKNRNLIERTRDREIGIAVAVDIARCTCSVSAMPLAVVRALAKWIGRAKAVELSEEMKTSEARGR
jgi:hypothetical protein